MKNLVKDCIEEHLSVVQKMTELITDITNASDKIYFALKNGKKIMLCGNGGSAADAQHIAAEFTCRFVKERRALPAVALTTDTSALTAIGNDYGFECIFARQLEALAQPGDILIGFTTSGNSQNVINALMRGNEIGCITIGLTGRDGGKLTSVASTSIVVPSSSTARIQEMHIMIGHVFCDFIDEKFENP